MKRPDPAECSLIHMCSCNSREQTLLMKWRTSICCVHAQVRMISSTMVPSRWRLRPPLITFSLYTKPACRLYPRLCACSTMKSSRHWYSSLGTFLGRAHSMRSSRVCRLIMASSRSRHAWCASCSRRSQ